ncbi:MAG: hypothetical protein QNJ37_24615, partial [Crocosphaera sp.]|nr:hypothetical protein [Crocosphaera sp.]
MYKKEYKNILNKVMIIVIFSFSAIAMLHLFNNYLVDKTSIGETLEGLIMENKDTIRLREDYPRIDFFDYHMKDSICILKPNLKLHISETIMISNGEIWHRVSELKNSNSEDENLNDIDSIINENNDQDKNLNNTHIITNTYIIINGDNDQPKRLFHESEYCDDSSETSKKWFIGKYRYPKKSINIDYQRIYQDKKYIIRGLRLVYFVYKTIHFYIGIRLAIVFYEKLNQDRFLNLKRMVALVLISMSLMTIIPEYSGNFSYIADRQINIGSQNLIGNFIQDIGLFVFDNSSFIHNISVSFICSMLLLQLFSFPVKS